MGQPSNAAAAAMASLTLGFLPPASEKLSRGNYSMWHAQVINTLVGAQYAHHIAPNAAPPPRFLEGAVDPATGKKAEPSINPDYTKWVSQDAQVLSYLFNSLSKEIFAQVSSATTATALWAAIQAQHASQSRARMISTRMALATASKGTSSVAEYFTKMKGLADDLASAGKKLDDEDLVSFILTGLGDDFDSVVTAVSTRVEPISIPELYAQLVSYEQRRGLNIDANSTASANVATKGGRTNNSFSRGSGSGSRGNGRSGGGQGRGGQSGGGGRGKNFVPGLICQICGKEGHPAYRCFKRFNNAFQGPPPQQKSASSAMTSSYGVDTNWYMDSGATDHITGELEKLTFRNKYNGGDQVQAADGAGMEIANVGHSTFHSQTKNFHLKNILHVPQATKNLCSVNRLAKDNHVFLEFHPNHFFYQGAGDGENSSQRQM